MKVVYDHLYFLLKFLRLKENIVLSLTEILEYTLYREGQVLIPFEAFKMSMDKIETLFLNVVREYEQYVPRTDNVFMRISKEGVYLPDVYAVKSLGFAGNSSRELIPLIIRPTNPRYWHWDKSTHILQTQVSAEYLVKCLKYYTFTKLHYLDELGLPICGQEEFSGKLIAEPDITSLRFKSGCLFSEYDTIETCCNGQSIVRCSGPLGDVLYNTDTRIATIMIDQHLEEPIVAEYLTKYKGFQELNSGDNLLNDWFAAEFYTAIGSLHQVTQIQQSPIAWNSANLLEYGRNLRASVIERRSQQMNFFDWLP